MGEKFSFNTEIDLTEVEVEVKVSSYTPYRPAPDCSNPDSPKFSDPGDDEDFDWELVFILRDSGNKIIKEIPFPKELYYNVDSDKMNELISKTAPGMLEYDPPEND